ncbi:DUF5666 domain-containing protein [Rhodoferax sp.]|uniref:DUF5666 domain-containing protein n=1 Tax=Rhodoferax sp. TaxID=50421 RepID=UPI00272748E5|nr:DUF5666 domain-containing protein [Rhodoferax sp.]MDO8319598.1 DUF5666 domain-containing protein [Rhodoferax sp.]
MTAHHLPELLSRRAALLTLSGTALHLTGCGGGGGGALAGLSSGGTGGIGGANGGTGSFTSGTITGLGSIIVNGIRYDDRTASVVSRDDNTPLTSPLKLGMVVSIQGSAVTPATTATATATATASRISVGSEWQGPIEALGSSTLTVFGLTVDTLASTLFDGAAHQFSGLLSNHFVEIFGYLDTTTGHLQASRIESSTTQPAQYRLSGRVSAKEPAQASFQIGNTRMVMAPQAEQPAAWADGDVVRVQLNVTPLAGVWRATRVQLLGSPLLDLEADDEDEAEIHGTITAFQTSQSFHVNGILVNASGALVTGTLGLGVRVEIKGTISAQTVLAQKVEAENKDSADSQVFEFYGQVSLLDTQAQTFVLRSYTFHYSANTRLKNINWAINPVPLVELKATQSNGRWEATAIELDD